MSRTYRKINPRGSVYRRPKGYVKAIVNNARARAIPPSVYDDVQFSHEYYIVDRAIEKMIGHGLDTVQIAEKIYKKFKIPKYLVIDIIHHKKRSSQLREMRWPLYDKNIKYKNALIKNYWDYHKHTDTLKQELDLYKDWYKHGKKRIYFEVRYMAAPPIFLERSVKMSKAIDWLKEYIEERIKSEIPELIRKGR